MKSFSRDLSIWHKLSRTRKLLILLAITVLFFAGFLFGAYVSS